MTDANSIVNVCSRMYTYKHTGLFLCPKIALRAALEAVAGGLHFCLFARFLVECVYISQYACEAILEDILTEERVHMISSPEQATFTTLPLDRIVSKLPVRRLSQKGLARIQESMRRSGFLDNYPLVVAPYGEGYQLIDGNHRYEAAKAAGLTSAPCVIKDSLSENDLYRLALQSNDAAETVVPSTLVTHAEFIWERSKEGKTQEEIADMLGWKRPSVRDYALLQKIAKEAWDAIVATFENTTTSGDDEVATSFVATATFTERLLRDILPLKDSQQIELVKDLASGSINKSRFKTLAESYRARNEMKKYALEQLGELGEPYTEQLIEAIYSGSYDNDWKNTEHPKLHKLIQSLRDEWERKNSIHVVHGDFYEEVKKIGAGSIDLIITDPPYNVANEREFSLEGRSNISQDFGEWDKFEQEQFIAFFDIWAVEWARILREQGSGYVFTSDIYLSHLRTALENAGLQVKTAIVWHKTNPGTQIVKTTFKSSVEYILFFTKGQSGYTFNWQGENEMHNFIEAPICGGNERLTNAKGMTLHPTQKPERVIRHLMEISSNRGDMVFDGFMGVATTGAVAKKLGRKFTGIEQDKTFFDASVERLSDD